MDQKVDQAARAKRLLPSCGWPARNRIFAAFCVTMVVLLFAAGLGWRDLWKPDEPRVAGIAAEMARTGDWIVPRLNGKPFLEKPPLYLWGVAASFRIFGETAGVARATSVLAAIAAVFLVFHFSRRLGSSQSGALMAAVVLGTSANFWDVGRRCLPDMQLALCIGAAMYCCYEAVHAARHRWLWVLGYSGALAAGMMTKGLVAVAIPLLALGCWFLWSRQRSVHAWLCLGGGVALALIPVCAWLFALWQAQGWDTVYTVVWTNNIGRFTGSHPEHIAPFHYYLVKFPGQFLPWALFIPAAVKEWRRRWRGQEDKDPLRFLLCWFFAPLLLLSLSAGKRGVYLVPLYPAAAMLVAPGITVALARSKAVTKWGTIPLTFLSFALPVGAVSAVVFSMQSGQLTPFAIVSSTALAAAGTWACVAVVQRNWPAVAVRLPLATVIAFAVFGMVVQPLLNDRSSYRSLLHEVEATAGPYADICLYKPSERLLGAAVFYLGHSVRVTHNLARLTDPGVVGVIRAEGWTSAPPAGEVEWEAASKHFLVISAAIGEVTPVVAEDEEKRTQETVPEQAWD
ncbi:MAG: glycosyltransferase family 39 protein [Victivallales bacterium]|jgi:4-amino-4-deoxy-L-arabinose transferase-like glycosyltransferase|nr:glycosyltransferase family 39 protein [Lentisphaerota bacterium]MBT7057748.1 glycosyltransferase family 39 protein [Lentisphaerota bacterium]MBT7304768.1 glycosyltransferase family 39 protein [Victivallales bacterium]